MREIAMNAYALCTAMCHSLVAAARLSGARSSVLISLHFNGLIQASKAGGELEEEFDQRIVSVSLVKNIEKKQFIRCKKNKK